MRESLTAEIKASLEILRKVRKDRDAYGRDEQVLGLCKARYEMVYGEVHGRLAEMRTAEAESEIRRLVKEVCANDLAVCESKIERFKTAVEYYKQARDGEKEIKAWRYLGEWLALYEKNYALVAFRSLEHFARYMEWEVQDQAKVWKYSIDPRNDKGKTGVNFPFFYYFNKMVLNKDIKFISKQYPTGYGKSFSNIVAISWLLGIDSNNDVLLVLGNPALVLTQTKGVVDMMTNLRYAKVFPKYAEYVETEEFVSNGVKKTRSSVNVGRMFSVCRQKDGELTLANSNKALNLKVISKDTSIDGLRIRYLFIDDVCRSKDAGNNRQHEIDIKSFWNSWWKRNYNTEDFYIVAGGTAYSIYDILSTLIRYYSQGTMRNSVVNKYTYLNEKGDSVFIKIPKLDPITDESTYPQRFPTEEARQIRARDERSFMAMEQQEPQPPETTPFYWDNLLTYDFIPQENRCDYCWATLDPVRIGGDNFAMSIFRKIGDLYYLIDCIYEQKEPEKLYQLVVDKISQHKITQLNIERNTDTSLKHLFDKMLREQDIPFCNITETYTYEKKEVRITNMQNTIKTKIVFPSEHLYARSSAMGRFMFDLVSYSWGTTKTHDDSIDAVTMFCETLLQGKTKKYATIGTFRR